MNRSNRFHGVGAAGILLLSSVAPAMEPCPPNPAGGPNVVELVTRTLSFPGMVSELDIGWTGAGHEAPAAARLNLCLRECAVGAADCVVDPAASRAASGGVLAPPVPIEANGVPLCVVPWIASTPDAVAGTANLSTGVVDIAVALDLSVHATAAGALCPECTGASVGDAGTCAEGENAGAACTTQTVVFASGRTYRMSADCPPGGAPIGTSPVVLPLQLGIASLDPATCASPGAAPCAPATCSEDWCSSTEQGIRQTCCSDDSQQSCFPEPGLGPIVREGLRTIPSPQLPDASFPKTQPFLLLTGMGCAGATESTLANAALGLGGPVAAAFDVTATWRQAPLGPSTGFVPPDVASLRCARRASRQVAGLVAKHRKCQADAATAALFGREFSEIDCTRRAVGRFVRQITSPGECPACVRQTPLELASDVQAAMDAARGFAYCAGTVPFPDANSGVVPPDLATLACEAGIGGDAARLVASRLRCIETHARSRLLGAVPTDLAACNAAASGRYAEKTGDRARCPQCARANVWDLEGRLVALVDEVLRPRLYCAGATPL